MTITMPRSPRDLQTDRGKRRSECSVILISGGRSSRKGGRFEKPIERRLAIRLSRTVSMELCWMLTAISVRRIRIRLEGRGCRRGRSVWEPSRQRRPSSPPAGRCGWLASVNKLPLATARLSRHDPWPVGVLLAMGVACRSIRCAAAAIPLSSGPQKIRIGTMDLKIAAIVLIHQAHTAPLGESERLPPGARPVGRRLAVVIERPLHAILPGIPSCLSPQRSGQPSSRHSSPVGHPSAPTSPPPRPTSSSATPR